MRPLRLLILVLAGCTVAAGYYRYRFEGRGRGGPPPLIAQVRSQLGLMPVLAAEAALRARPDDPQLRLRLAEACAGSGDVVGAALALYPILDRINGIDRMGGRTDRTDQADRTDRTDVAGNAGGDMREVVGRFVEYCARIGWREEGAAALQGAPDVSPGAKLALADAYALSGEAPRAVALLAALEREGAQSLGMSDWLDGAMTWYQCRRPERASRWAERAVALGGVRREAPGVSSSGGDTLAPDSSELAPARAVLARCLLAVGKPEAALGALPAGAPGVAVDPMVEYWRARAGLRSGDATLRRGAVEHLTHLGMGDPPDPVAAFEAGREQLRAGRAAPAAALLSRAANASYQAVLCYDLLARAYERMGRAASAAWARGRAQSERGEFSAAAASLRRSAALDPSPVGVYPDLARAQMLAGRSREALGVLEAARKRHPGSVDLALAEAEALNQLDRFGEQAAVLEAAAALDPARAVEPLRELGRMYHETRQFDRVIPALERALPQGESDAAVHRYLGLAYALHPDDPERAEKAVTHLLRAAALDPDDSVQWTNAGGVLQRLGYPDEAAACYRRAIAWDSWSGAPYVSLSQALQRQGRAAEAKLLLRLYRERRSLTARRQALENRVAADRSDAAAHFELGDLLLRHVSFRQAYPYLLIAASQRPAWREAQLRLADVCALLDYGDLGREAEQRAGVRCSVLGVRRTSCLLCPAIRLRRL